MTDSIQPASSPTSGRAVITACLLVVAGAVLGLAAGLIWAAVAPRVQYEVYTLNPPTAYATNPETSAFIAADGWYCLLAVLGGALLGLLGYLFGVRRYGPVPMVGIVVGATAAAFECMWLGHQQSGGPGFNHVLATSKPGTLLRAPISLGSHGALAFWPLAAAAVAGGIELIGVLRARRQPGYGVASVAGPDSGRPRPAERRWPSWPPQQQQQQPPPPPPPPFSAPPGQPWPPEQPGDRAPPGEETSGRTRGVDPMGGDPGRAAL